MRFMSGLLQFIFFLAVVWASLLAAGLISNDLPWSDPPGMGTRLMTYLTTNVAGDNARHRLSRTPATQVCSAGGFDV